jgi:hypothetical protein
VVAHSCGDVDRPTYQYFICRPRPMNLAGGTADGCKYVLVP